MLKLLVIADPVVPVPPSLYGGAERAIAGLCGELKRLGHHVRLLAGPGSEDFGGGVRIHRAPTSAFASRAYRKLRFQPQSLAAARGVDAILNFGRLDYLEALSRTRIPLLCCFQNPVPQSEIDWVLARRRHRVHFVGVSHSQMEGLVPGDRISVVHNATDTSRFEFSEPTSDPAYLAFLGRITENKGADTAIRVARRTGLRLKIGGTISGEPGGHEFFEREIRPQLDDQIEWIGPVDDERKGGFLGKAQALLFPIRWKEPCALVVSESLACGTPVIATRCASTPEVLDDGVTGFLCDGEDEMVAAVARISSIDRRACRLAAENRFSYPVMAGNYLRAVERLLSESDGARR